MSLLKFRSISALNLTMVLPSLDPQGYYIKRKSVDLMQKAKDVKSKNSVISNKILSLVLRDVLHVQELC